MTQEISNAMSFTEWVASAPPSQFEVNARMPPEPVVARLKQGDVLGALGKDGLASLLDHGAVKTLHARGLALIGLMTGKRTDLDDLFDMSGCLIGKANAVIRDDAAEPNAFHVCAYVDGTWFSLARVSTSDKVIEALLPVMVRTGSSPADRELYEHRLARLTEYQANLAADEAEKQAMRDAAAAAAEREIEADRIAQELRSGITRRPGLICG